MAQQKTYFTGYGATSGGIKADRALPLAETDASTVLVRPTDTPLSAKFFAERNVPGRSTCRLD
jgi:hypothetical protein